MCGSAIGVRNAASKIKYAMQNILELNYFLLYRNDAILTGYTLGHPTTRSNIPSPERSLSPAACCIVRAIMHSALLWVSCNDDNATEGLVALVKSGLTSPQELPEFFWGHLERDVQLLAKALGKNPEDAAIVVHLVLRSMATNSPPSAAIPLTTQPFGTLENKDVRSQWEEQFSRCYIIPILEVYTPNFSLVCVLIEGGFSFRP